MGATMSPYRRPVPAAWWLKKRVYFLFILREFTSVFIAIYVILFLLMLYNLSIGRAAYEAYLRFLATPGMIGFHVLALIAALYHTFTWFSLVPNINVVRIGEDRVPAIAIVAPLFIGWIVVSAMIAWIVLVS